VHPSSNPGWRGCFPCTGAPTITPTFSTANLRHLRTLECPGGPPQWRGGEQAASVLCSERAAASYGAALMWCSPPARVSQVSPMGLTISGALILCRSRLFGISLCFGPYGSCLFLPTDPLKSPVNWRFSEVCCEKEEPSLASG
jgi:hypothetical protein